MLKALRAINHVTHNFAVDRHSDRGAEYALLSTALRSSVTMKRAAAMAENERLQERMKKLDKNDRAWSTFKRADIFDEGSIR